MKNFVLAAAVVAVCSFAATANAADNPTGTWKWTVTFNNQSHDATLKLKLDGDKLTGALLGRDNKETAIDDASFKDGDVKFSVTRERNGKKFTQKFSGKLSGDTIKGKIEMERDGNATSRDWEAKKAPE